jgi:hypothetical protein
MLNRRVMRASYIVAMLRLPCQVNALEPAIR